MPHEFLHQAVTSNGDALVLTHGAGSNYEAPLLVAIAEVLARKGVTVLRVDLAFRRERLHGPPFPAGAARDRESLREALLRLRGLAPGRIFAGGHSYGGRQATLLAAETPAIADGLLLLSYPLHPPRRAAGLRTAHFPELRTPALFVHGSRDPFGSLEEMRAAIPLIAAGTQMVDIAGAGHDLGPPARVAPTVAEAFLAFAAQL